MKVRDDDKNSMLYWYEKIVGHVPTPETVMINVGFARLLRFMDDNDDLADKLPVIKKAAKAIGYPIFLRTDLSSDKHQWNDTCFVPNPRALVSHIGHVIDGNLSADFLGLPCSAIVLRKFLRLKTAFRAFNGMPVAREFRCFADSGQVLCIHPYWHEEAILFWRDTKEPENWRTMLKGVSELPNGDDLKRLREIVSTASKLVSGYWSIDICQTEAGKWYLTDMAVGYDSEHWKGCEKVKIIG